MATLLLVMSDPHAGHKLGLLAPGVELYDERPTGEIVRYSPALTAFQDWAWFDVYVPGLSRAAQLANGAPIVILNLGDMVHGDGHAEQLICTRMADQITIACANMRAALDLPNVRAARFVFGTGVHEFGEGSAALMVASAMRIAYPAIDIGSLYHGLLTVDGATVDCAHHGPGTGNRLWLYGNNVRYYLRDIMLQEIVNGNTPPAIVLRGHVHTYARELLTIGTHTSQMVIAPSLCGLSDYARKASKSASSLTVGMVAFLLDAGRVVDCVPMIETIDVRTREVI